MPLRVFTDFTGAAVVGGGVSTMVFFGEDQAAAQASADAVEQFWVDLDVDIGAAVTYQVRDEVEAFDPLTGDTTQVWPVTTSPGTGSAAGDLMPKSTQGLIRWRTGVFVEGREIRGRTFIPGPSGSDNVAGAPSAAYVTALNTAGANLIADAASGLMVWRRPNAELGNTGQVELVVSASGWNQWAVLRSRRD